MKPVDCNSVQESIALNEALSPDHQTHLSQCENCQSVFQQHTQLEELLALDSEVSIPESFADSVMHRIEQETTPSQADWFSKLQAWAVKWVSEPAPQWVLLTFGVAMSASNFLRFVFYILTPAGN